jgi:hypothetical protein
MANHILKRQPTTMKLQSVLDEALGADYAVGLSAAPRVETSPGTLTAASPPYVILYPLWVNLSGPAFGADRHADAEWTYQVTGMALRGDQLEWVRDRVLEVVLGKDDDGRYVHDLDTPGVKITERDLKEDSGIGEAVGSVLPTDIRFGLFATRS